MEQGASVNRLRQEITERFPADAKLVEARIEELGYDADADTAWFEQFSQRTTEAIRVCDEELASAHLSFMSEKLKNADAVAREYIDVYYVESLMWNLGDEGKRYGWTLIPQNLRDLYVAMWGEPR